MVILEILSQTLTIRCCRIGQKKKRHHKSLKSMGIVIIIGCLIGHIILQIIVFRHVALEMSETSINQSHIGIKPIRNFTYTLIFDELLTL